MPDRILTFLAFAKPNRNSLTMNLFSSTIDAPVLTTRNSRCTAREDAPAGRPRRVGLDLHIVDGKFQGIRTHVIELFFHA